MLQYKQNSSKLPMDIGPVLTVNNEDPLAQADTLKIISCPICRAVYISSSQQQAATPGSLALLESAFLSICHRCFHCQRSACPQCWNPIHHTCAACCEEALLPFRSPVPSLEGLFFSARPASQADQTQFTSFTCLHNGRFYTFEQALRHAPLAQNVENTSSPISTTKRAAVPAQQTTPEPAIPAPSWLQEIGNQPSEAPAKGLPSRSSGQWKNIPPVKLIKTRATSTPAQPVQAAARPTVVLAQPAQPEGSQMAHTLSHVSPLPAQKTDERVNGQRLLDELLDDDEDEISLFERIENVLIVVISVLLLAIVLMIVLAISSPTMNTFFFHLLHIDIRSEILYLLQVK